MGPSAVIKRPLLWIAGGLLTLVWVPCAPPAAADDPAPAATPLITPPAEFVTNLERSEETCDQAMGSVKSTFLKGLRCGDAKLLGAGLTDDFVGRFPAPAGGAAEPDPDLAIRRYRSDGLPDLDRPAFVALLQAHIQGWTMVERAGWQTFEFLLDPGSSRAYAQVHFRFGGRRPDGSRADVQATVQAQVVGAGPGTWKIRRLALVEGFRIEGMHPPFNDITDAAGFSFHDAEESRHRVQEIINSMTTLTGGGLTVLDWNHDGFWDLIATQEEKQAVLFLNDGKGGFTPRPLPLPLAGPEQVASLYLPIDLDNDGVDELVCNQVVASANGKARLGLYRQVGGTWQAVPDALEFTLPPGVARVWFKGIVPCDVDGDGLIDLFFCGYGTTQSRQDRYNTIAAEDGAPNLLFLNQGGLHFAEESKARGLEGTRYTYVAAFFDFLGNGRADLLEGNDFGPNVLWENLGGGRFRRRPDHPFSQGSNYTMGVAIADYNHSGTWSLNLSNMYSHAGNRILSTTRGLSPEMRKTTRGIGSGNQFYEYDPAAKAWRECAGERGVANCGWAWGSTFIDLSNRGIRDLFITNGFTSHEDAKAPDF